jgi:hypothetical protein
MTPEINHLFLVNDPDDRSAHDHVVHFFDTTTLARYEKIKIVEKEIISAENKLFYPRLDKALEENQEIIAGLIRELRQESGIDNINELAKIAQGFASKTLHTIAHLLDGFFGIDSCFFNLVEDSHGLSAELRKKINHVNDDDGDGRGPQAVLPGKQVPAPGPCLPLSWRQWLCRLRWLLLPCPLCGPLPPIFRIHAGGCGYVRSSGAGEFVIFPILFFQSSR